MNAKLEEDILDSLDEIMYDYDENGALDLDLAKSFVQKLINLPIAENEIDDIVQEFNNINNGNSGTKPDDDTPAESVKTVLFKGIQNMLYKAVAGLGKNSTATKSVSSKVRIEVQENGTKIITWDYNSFKTNTPVQKVIYLLLSQSPAVLYEFPYFSL